MTIRGLMLMVLTAGCDACAPTAHVGLRMECGQPPVKSIEETSQLCSWEDGGVACCRYDGLRETSVGVLACYRIACQSSCGAEWVLHSLGCTMVNQAEEPPEDKAINWRQRDLAKP